MSKPMQPVYLLFGARIQHVREILGMTQEELAKKVGLTRTSVANIEGGKQRVLLHDVDIFAKALGLNPKNILRGIWL
jgi:transcriptional regulator with XRE-family HTH domain